MWNNIPRSRVKPFNSRSEAIRAAYEKNSGQCIGLTSLFYLG